MNREELAALLAQTHGHTSHSQPDHPGRPSDPAPRSPPAARPQKATSPLSPRQLFQSQVQTLSDDGTRQNDPPLSPSRKSHELDYLSSLRVHVRSTTPTRSRPRSREARGYQFSFTPADPDWVVEERAAWNAESPGKRRETSDHGSSSHPDPYCANDDQHTLAPTELASSPPPRQSQGEVPLQSFGPISTSTDVDKRPKTRHGCEHGINCMPGAFPDTRGVRRSKFNEGSMNEKSSALSSTWDEHGTRLSESSERSGDETDSDATPRASRMSRDSDSSFDVSDFKPQPTTPSTIKNKLSRLGSHFKSSGDSARPAEVQKKDKRKGLRKSISNWNFHSLGEKMRFFGSSTHDLGAEDSPIQPHKAAETEILDDRKRKAEETYSQQFGTKRQKFNDGVAVHDERARAPAKPRMLKKRSTSALRTITPSTVRRRRASSSNGSREPVDPADILSDGDIDHAKRVTRRELEKENQQLRAMLREQQRQQSSSMVRSASKSTVHLPFEDQHASSARRSPKASASAVSRQATADLTVKKQRKQAQSQDVPPVPALPSRTVLANLSTRNVINGRNSGAEANSKPRQHDIHFGAAETGTIKRVGGDIPRPVSAILEGDENGPGEETVSRFEPRVPSGLKPSPRKDQWQWPDDVF